MSLIAIKKGLQAYKRKLYLKRLLKGLLLTSTCFLVAIVIFSSLESLFWFGNSIRLLFFVLLLSTLLIPLYQYIIIPVLELLKIKKGIDNETMAKEIGQYFPEVSDKLLNLIQLDNMTEKSNALLLASISQKENELKHINFTNAIKFEDNKNFLLAFGGVLGILILISFFGGISPLESTTRIIQFKQQFSKPAPFKFKIENENLIAYANEDFKLNLVLKGESLPTGVNLYLGDNSIKMNKADANAYNYSFRNLKSDIQFQFEASGFYSKPYTISLVHRPEIKGLEIEANFPSYTQLSDKTFINQGNIIVPEGSVINWKINTASTESITIQIDSTTQTFQKDEDLFTYTQQIKESSPYTLALENQHSANSHPIKYRIEVIKDLYPELEVQFVADTILFSSLIVSGNIQDDYGFRNLTLIEQSFPSEKLQKHAISIDKNKNQEAFLYQWKADWQTETTYKLFWIEVGDNDAINGSKIARSSQFKLKPIDKQKIDELITERTSNTENQIKNTQEQTEAHQNKIDEIRDRLRNKDELGWQEEKMIKDLLKERNEIQKNIEELQQKHEELIATHENLDHRSEKIMEKSKELQSLMEELLDDETKAMYEELQKLMEENQDASKIEEQLSKLSPNSENLEQELERALNLFKQMKFDMKMESITDKLDELSKEQQELAQQEKNAQEQVEQQNEINKKFDQLSEEMEELEKMNQELQRPEDLSNLDEQEQDIQKDMDELSEQMENRPNSKKNKSQQQQIGDKMQQMAQSMKNMQGAMEMDALSENIENLKHILDNLVKLSFEQERIVNDFRGVSQIDPRFLVLSQDQLKLGENSKVIEDSLIALANRVTQISNFVTREINEINRSMDQALDALKDRNTNRAQSHQSFTMTSMNNLALLLSDVLNQMQQAMAQSMGNPKSGKSQKSKANMSQLQQQLSQQIEDLKKSGKSGRQLSEELAKLAAEQAKIRKEMEALQKQLEGQNPGEEGEGDGEGNGTKGLKEAIEQMEKNEEDLVNKRLNQTLINRQQQIMTRMLEAESSMRNQGQEEKRESETATQKARKTPTAFEEYLKARESEIEILNSIPLDLKPFYKKEVNQYFKRLSVQER